jgi:asparagine synthase (glutamine-hydrolysing)
MCGIAGIISPQPNDQAAGRLQRMTAALAHRGPDGEGYWQQGAAALGHRRLAIIDTGPAAAQPMHYADRYTIVHNGEIYNYIELRDTLRQKGYRFTSQSDTEVILAAYDCWQQDCLQQLEGMFAFAIWDAQEQTLFAARDRLGEKPFHYGMDGDGNWLFASEMKALWAAGLPSRYEPALLLNYLTLGWVQNPHDKAQTFFKGIASLPPASYLLYQPGAARPMVHTYWQLPTNPTLHGPSPLAAATQVLDLLQQSVRLRLRSDVPVGTSLSGGIDSGSIAALVNQHTPHIHSFSAIFPGFAKDESANVALTANHLGIPNHTTQPDAEGLLAHFDKLCYHQEQPFGSASIFAQYKVFERAAQQGITVLLDGQGADELLAGYGRYLHWYLQELWQQDKKAFAQEKAALLENGHSFQWGIANRLAAHLPALAAGQLERRARRQQLHHPYLEQDFTQTAAKRNHPVKPIITSLHDILRFDTVQMGLEELLRYADRNSMAHGREVRLPFLSTPLVELAFSLPAQYKIHQGYTKWVLRQAMADLLPQTIAWQTNKTGFEPPQQQWMRHEGLQQRIHAARARLVQAGILRKTVLQKPIQPLSAHAADNFDWRCLTAAGTLL